MSAGVGDYGPGPGAAAVLAALRATGEAPLAHAALSGALLSEQLGVSRAQVWKHVEALRALGYRIEGEPGGGYRLLGTPDRFYPDEIRCGLDTRWLARRVHAFDTTDSTNRVAIELARAGAEHGTTVVAEGQTAGRGRLGRQFFSPPGLNLYTSTLLRPGMDIADAPTLILTSGAAVADAIAETVGEPARVELKWPNDVLIDGLKTSGILMELGAEGSRVAFVVLGIGVNLNVDRDIFPDEFRDLATSLRSATGRTIDRLAFARRMYHGLENALDAHAEGGFAAVRPLFERYFRMQGRAVEVREMMGRDGDSIDTAGTCRGIDEDGALRIERRDGSIARIVAGDVTLVKPPREGRPRENG